MAGSPLPELGKPRQVVEAISEMDPRLSASLIASFIVAT